MRKILLSFLVLSISCAVSFAKPVDENTAQTIGFDYLQNQGGALKLSDLSLVYQATSSVNGISVTDFYVFNAANGGFVIVSADDRVKPVLAYDMAATFKYNSMFVNVNDWMNMTKDEINSVITGNTITKAAVTQQWSALTSQSRPASSVARTTTTGWLLRTVWNQAPYVNQLCPYDATDSALTVTGCVATAMAQVMKYWGWPVTGTGNNNYMSPYGLLSADFDTETYVWDSMPNIVSDTNVYVAQLMLAAGISVDMDYGVDGSGAAFDIPSSGPGVNCAQMALETYFSYKTSTLQSVSRDTVSDTNWIDIIIAEVNAKRPVLYDGFDPTVGGHAYVADGYNADSFIHFNWGWGGTSNGYYNVDNLDPDGYAFNNDQHLIIGIMPDTVTLPPATPPVTGLKQVVAGGEVNIYPNPATDAINIDLNGTKATSISLTDLLGRTLTAFTPASTASIITIPVNDYADGMYLVEVQTATGTLSKQIVVAK